MHSERGFALPLVLLVSVLAISMFAGMHAQARNDALSVRVGEQQLQLRYAAERALHQTVAHLYQQKADVVQHLSDQINGVKIRLQVTPSTQLIDVNRAPRAQLQNHFERWLEPLEAQALAREITLRRLASPFRALSELPISNAVWLDGLSVYDFGSSEGYVVDVKASSDVAEDAGLQLRYVFKLLVNADRPYQLLAYQEGQVWP